jgi:carboxyl-terminal processing protease
MLRAALSPLLVLVVLPAQPAAYEPGVLFDAVAKAIATAYHDKGFRKEDWPALVARYQDAAHEAADLAEERAIVDGLLRHVPASHLALYSKAELSRREQPTLGLELEQRAGRFFVAAVLEDGPALRAGVRRGDRILAVDGDAPGASPRLDRSSDDAYLDDPPRHQLLAEDGETVVLRLQRQPDAEPDEVEVTSAPYSAWRAAQASPTVYEVDGRRIGYVHYWFIHLGGVHAHFAGLLRDEFADCDACVLDLRGRGGDGAAVAPLVAAVKDAGMPMVALIDRGTRSAKEVIAYRLRQEEAATLVGEHTARAVIPASFRRVGKDDVLMFPTFTLGKYTDAIEGVGVAPHVAQPDHLPFAAGDDPILRAGLRVAAASLGNR